MSDSKRDIARESVVFTARLEHQTVLNDDFTPEQVNGYWADVLHIKSSDPHPPAWCGAFALWCLHQAGLGLEFKWEFGPPHFGFLYHLKQLTYGAAPEPGDIGYQDQPYRHHFVVERVEGETVHTIEGNQGPKHPINAGARPLSDHRVVYYSIAKLLPPDEPEVSA